MALRVNIQFPAWLPHTLSYISRKTYSASNLEILLRTGRVYWAKHIHTCWNCFVASGSFPSLRYLTTSSAHAKTQATCTCNTFTCGVIEGSIKVCISWFKAPISSFVLDPRRAKKYARILCSWGTLVIDGVHLEVRSQPLR